MADTVPRPFCPAHRPLWGPAARRRLARLAVGVAAAASVAGALHAARNARHLPRLAAHCGPARPEDVSAPEDLAASEALTASRGIAVSQRVASQGVAEPTAVPEDVAEPAAMSEDHGMSEGFAEPAPASADIAALEGVAAPVAVPEDVTVLVPARDEAGTIEGCVRMLCAQVEVPRLRIRVLDDDSSDGTGSIARRAAAGDPRVTVIDGLGDPPAGWLGKPWACQRLADGAPGSVLVFCDADVRLRPEAVAAGVAQLRQRGLHLLSPWPRQLARTPLARLVQPLQQWSWLTTLPLRLAETSPRPQLAAANGQFLIMDADAYRACGGHGSVRGEVLEDIALARAFKRQGLRAGLADASAVAECLMYRTDAEVVTGYGKSLWRSFGGPLRGMAAGAALLAVYTLAPLALASRDRAVRLLAATAYAGAVAGRVVAARATGGAVWPDSAAQPLSAAAFAWLTIVSAQRHWRGANRWRGRPVVPTRQPPG